MKICLKCKRNLFDRDTFCDKCKSTEIIDYQEYKQVNEKPEVDKVSFKTSRVNFKVIIGIVLFWGLIILLSLDFPSSDNDWKVKFNFVKFILMAILPAIPTCMSINTYTERKLMRDRPEEYAQRKHEKFKKQEFYRKFHESQRNIQNQQATTQVTCPKCNSTQIHAEKRGWKITTGFLGSSQIMITCLNCGHKWKAGKN